MEVLLRLENILFIKRITSVMALTLLIVLFVIIAFKRKSDDPSKKHHPRDMLQQILESTELQLQKKGRYEERQSFLSKMGVNYVMGRTVSPEEFLLVKVATSIFLTIIFTWSFGIVGGGIGWCIGYFGYEIVIRLANNATNERMLPDIKNIFDTLKIKTEGGMFLTAAITECYKSTRNPRLKQALFEMNGQLIAKNDINETIDDFGMKFKNKQIDTLCIILKQSMESGKTVDILKDISDQLADMQQAINLKVKNKMDTQILSIQVFMYVLILIICVYGVVISMGGELLIY